MDGTTEVVEGDTLVNHAAAIATVLDTGTLASTGNTIGDGSAGVATAGASASISIDRGSLSKTIYAINGETDFATPAHVSPGDVVTYRLRQVFPTSRTDGFRMIDYLPLPVFYAAGLTSFDPVSNATAPAAGHAQWGPADTFHDNARRTVAHGHDRSHGQQPRVPGTATTPSTRRPRARPTSSSRSPFRLIRSPTACC